ncbi:hypothetical protein EI77_00089 [Prosthecobacter fusiformis]|uniref:Uncharacterized protein n=1 Tax=Prosthecobacter fusiformis TaxID=48464 RepID=A0A4R7SNP2_9BACT|nr:hypothetical protein [Prosthecobacter fusiformis]TDU80792.1 hypothetical protein EI77_00089 [Prosthecobacter fusiformis]
MAKQRIVNTRFWDDSYIALLSPHEKLLFLYLLTSPLTTIAGVYEIPVKRIGFDTGLAMPEIKQGLAKLEADGKILRQEDWIAIVNFVKHQTLNPKVRQGILLELNRSPQELVKRLPSSVQGLVIQLDRLSHSNSNPNSNLNFKAATPEPASPAVPQDIRREIHEMLGRRRP